MIIHQTAHLLLADDNMVLVRDDDPDLPAHYVGVCLGDLGELDVPWPPNLGAEPAWFDDEMDEIFDVFLRLRAPRNVAVLEDLLSHLRAVRDVPFVAHPSPASAVEAGNFVVFVSPSW